MFMWHSFDCWSLCDVWHSFDCWSLCGDGVHRGVTAGLCFDCWSLCDTVPGDGVHRGVTAGLCFVWHSFAFLPYLETVYAEVLELVDYPAVGIKKAAIATLGQLCLCVHETCSNTPSGDAENGELCSLGLSEKGQTSEISLMDIYSVHMQAVSFHVLFYLCVGISFVHWLEKGFMHRSMRGFEVYICWVWLSWGDCAVDWMLKSHY